MGRDILTTGVFADGPDEGRLQYEPPKLLFRGAQRRVWDGEALKGVRAEGADLVLADDLAAVIDTLGLKDVILVGHSMGGAEVVRYLGKHGTAKVKKVALVAAVAPYVVQTADNPYGAPMAYHQATLKQYATDFPKWAMDNQAAFFTPETSPAMKAWLTEQLLATSVPVAVAAFKALIGKDLRPDLPKIDRPTLVIHGDKDASAPLAITGQRLAAGIKGADLKVYPGAPHGLFVTHMDRLNTDLEAFFRA